VAIDVSTLNPPQREAVVHWRRPAARPRRRRSGKTRVITYRVARLVERGVPAKAHLRALVHQQGRRRDARALERIVGPRDADLLTLSTFHSLGLAC
jgi:DNA helicase-2/ATP-dependent DNA helicase PcrA